MTTPSGQIALSDVNTELGYSSTATISMNDAAVRNLAGVPSGQISMSNLQGKSAVWVGPTISSPQANLDLYSWAIGQGYPGSGKVKITIGPGAYIYATSTGNAGLTIPSGFGAGNLTLINQGYIMGAGGSGSLNPAYPWAGPTGYYSFPAGGPGGPALSIATPIILTNQLYIAGGGGAGGSGGQTSGVSSGGGGAGGGTGGTASTLGAGNVAGGAGAFAGGTGSNGTWGKGNASYVSVYSTAGGGGGIINGSGGSPFGYTNSTAAGTSSYYGNGGYGGGAGGGGGAAGGYINTAPTTSYRSVGSAGGGGGGWGAAGGSGLGASRSMPGAYSYTSGAGGSSNGAGGSATDNLPAMPGPWLPAIVRITGAGGGGGNAISLNGNSINYPQTGTIWGTVG